LQNRLVKVKYGVFWVKKHSTVFMRVMLALLIILLISFPCKAEEWGTPIQITFNRVADWRPYISGDGTKIVYVSDVDGDTEVYVVNTDGTGLKKLTNNTADDWWPCISHDGSKITFSSNLDGDQEIFVISMDVDSPVIVDEKGTGSAFPAEFLLVGIAGILIIAVVLVYLKREKG